MPHALKYVLQIKLVYFFLLFFSSFALGFVSHFARLTSCYV